MANLHIVAACEWKQCFSGGTSATVLKYGLTSHCLCCAAGWEGGGGSGWIIVPWILVEPMPAHWSERTWCTKAGLTLKRIPVSGRYELDLWGPSLAGRRDRWSPDSFT